MSINSKQIFALPVLFVALVGNIGLCAESNPITASVTPAAALAALGNGKLLLGSKMALVDVGTTFEPFFMRDAWVLKEVAKGVFLSINNLKENAKKNNCPVLFATLQEESSFVQKNLGSILKHLTTLFAPVRDYKSIVVPLLTESLGVGKEPGQGDAILIKYFNTDVSISTETFFNGTVQDPRTLEQLCIECITFFNDLYKSLSDGSRKKLHQALQPIIAAAQKAQQKK